MRLRLHNVFYKRVRRNIPHVSPTQHEVFSQSARRTSTHVYKEWFKDAHGLIGQVLTIAASSGETSFSFHCHFNYHLFRGIIRTEHSAHAPSSK